MSLALGGHQWPVALILVLTWLLSSAAGWCALSSLESADGHRQWCIDGLVVLTQSETVLKLFASEDQALLVQWNTLLDEDLHTATPETEDKVEGRLLLDVVVQKGTSVFKLFASEDEALLVWGNAVWHIKLTFIVVAESLRT